MAVVSMPAPRSLMMRDAAVKMHGKKIAIYPDWEMRYVVFNSMASLHFGGLNYEIGGKIEEGYIFPFQKEPKPFETSYHGKELYPTLYYLVRHPDESAGDFEGRIVATRDYLMAHGQYIQPGQGIMYSSNNPTYAIFSSFGDCTKVIYGSVVTTCNVSVTDEDRKTRACAETLSRLFGYRRFCVAKEIRFASGLTPNCDIFDRGLVYVGHGEEVFPPRSCLWEDTNMPSEDVGYAHDFAECVGMAAWAIGADGQAKMLSLPHDSMNVLSFPHKVFRRELTRVPPYIVEDYQPPEVSNTLTGTRTRVNETYYNKQGSFKDISGSPIETIVYS